MGPRCALLCLYASSATTALGASHVRSAYALGSPSGTDPGEHKANAPRDLGTPERMLSEGYDSHGERKANPLGKNHREIPLKQGTPEKRGSQRTQFCTNAHGNCLDFGTCVVYT
jgi:hypothetical protein